MSSETRLDVAQLPAHDFDHKTTMWWGTIGFILIEATAFAAAIGGYYYLMSRADLWPPTAEPPDLGPGTTALAIMLVSLVPNHLMSKAAHEHDLKKVRVLMVLTCALGAAALVARAFEFGALNVRWNENAYGSIVWALIGLHTLHLATDVGETFVLTALMFTRHAHGKRFSDVSDNAFYWYFVVYSWIVIWLVVYGTPYL